MMVPGHQFQVYLTLTKSCEKATSQKNKRVYQKLQKGLKSILLLREFAKEKTTSKNKNAPKLQKRFKPFLS